MGFTERFRQQEDRPSRSGSEIEQIEQETAVARKLHGFQERMTELYSYFYYNPDIAPHEQDMVLSAAEADLPPVDTQALKELGIEEAAIELDEAATDGFRKEDTRVVPRSQFFVGTSPDGQKRLMKWPGKPYRRADDMEYPNITRMYQLQRLQGEAIASRIASTIGYPMPDTTLVAHEGEPWISSEFVEHARDAAPPSVEVGNIWDAYNRPFFNALIDARGDSVHQAIIDQSTGEYMAIDAACALAPSEADGDAKALEDKILSDLARGAYGGTVAVDRQVARHSLQTFAESLSGLDSARAKEIMSDRIGPHADKARAAEALLKRAEILKRLIAQGYTLPARGYEGRDSA